MQMLLIFFLILFVATVNAFLSKPIRQIRVKSSFEDSSSAIFALSDESRLLELISNISGRGTDLALPAKLEIESLINKLENVGLRQKRDESLLNGCWKLCYTSTPGNTQSPIQRSLTGFDGVSIYQVININGQPSFLGPKMPDVSNTVVLGDGIGRLRVTALASTSSNKLVQPRIGDGSILGAYPFGKSINTPPRIEEERIDFKFEEALFEFNSPIQFSIPYPVPFKLLGDEAKGFIDNTYYSERFRIARGNKGTVFLLEKADTKSDKKAAAAASKDFLTVPTKLIKKSGKKEKVAILFPSQLGTQHDYDELKRNVAAELGLRVYVAPLERLDWPVGLIGSFFTREFIEGKLLPSKTLAFYFKRVDEAVQQAIQESPDCEIVILSHSIGGWVARSWLSEWAEPNIKQRVRALLSLGSPHNPPPSGSSVAKVDQTRGLLTYINENYPGAYEPNVKYVSVIGCAVEGAVSADGGGEKLLAYSSYSVLCGEGTAQGDGIIPVATATLEGAKNLIVRTARHSNFIPTPFKQAFFLDAVWYGSEAVVREWASELRPLL